MCFQTQSDYPQQYVNRKDEFLEALLSRETMPENSSICQHCDRDFFAVWRCKDCVLATPMCRSCLQVSHRENLFHQIERWNGGFFQPAELSEVGTYLLIKHHSDEKLCDTLQKWCNQLKSDEEKKDSIEQDHLCKTFERPEQVPVPMLDYDFDDTSNDINESDIEDESDDNDDFEEDNVYLMNLLNAGASPAFISNYMANYIRVVHSNGLHHIVMVSCKCHGSDILPIDLFTAQLLPTSFTRIKTLFTSQVLDMFCLSNLKLKASAYQYYQLLCCLTHPTALAEVINLYREFHRMSWLWQWMKKLKWAGYPMNNKSINEVQAGELAIY